MEDPKGANDLGVAIKRLRGSRTQPQMVEAAGMSTSSWSDYERGKQNPRPRQLKRIAKALGCTVKELEQEKLKVAGERLSEAAEGAIPEPPETSDSLLEEMDRELQEIDQHLDHLLARKKRLLAFRRHLVELPPGTPMPGAS